MVATLEVDSRRKCIFVRFPYNAMSNDEIIDLGGIWDRDAEAWHVPDVNIDDVANALERLGYELEWY